MASSSSSPSRQPLDAFSKVDQMVAKTVFGSDGAASWQKFRNDTAELQRDSVAPGLQVKRADRLGTGLTTLQQERLHESAVRKQHGHAALGSGYSNFQKKHDAEEAANRKKRKRIENRIRPDEKKYFILAEAFDGWKFDYVFTTRDRGTGYYWDGMDSLKKLRGELEEPESSAESQTTETDPEKKHKPQLPDKKAKKKKKKKASKQPPVFVHNPNHPLEQVANAIRRRQAALNIPPSSNLLPAGWASAVDSTTGKTYFFNQGTGERQWDAPEIAGKCSAKSDLLEGWSEAKDKSGKTYYYHTNGETRWEKPTPHE